MHELRLTQEIVDICCRSSEGARVTRVVLEIGKLSCVLPDAIRFCFDLCAEGTAAAGAKLEILEPPGTARCLDCGALVELPDLLGQCACGGLRLKYLSGEELKIKEMEVI